MKRILIAVIVLPFFLACCTPTLKKTNEGIVVTIKQQGYTLALKIKQDARIILYLFNRNNNPKPFIETINQEATR